jgi:hypothetical protein
MAEIRGLKFQDCQNNLPVKLFDFEQRKSRVVQICSRHHVSKDDNHNKEH